ncbi:putative E3 ubiquitin-protein ligase [Sesbania bispinosa]|nr:putative E3 ubiquitin-protein ligase [Sesbania bispinosa]
MDLPRGALTKSPMLLACLSVCLSLWTHVTVAFMALLTFVQKFKCVKKQSSPPLSQSQKQCGPQQSQKQLGPVAAGEIQASIAKVVQRQSEALVKRRKDTPSAFVTRSQRNQRNIHSRRQNQVIDIQGSEDNEEENDNNEKDSSSGDERCTELRQRRRKRWTRVRPSQPSSSMASPDGGYIESDMDISRENRGISSQVSKPRKLTWGRGGFRSNTRHGSGGGSNSKSSRNNRLSKLVDHLKSLDENIDELNVHLMLVSMDKESTPSLQQPHLCCRPTLTVNHLYEYVARQTPLPVEGVEILAVKGCCSTKCDKSADENSTLVHELTTLVIDPCKDELEILQGHESLAEIRSKCISKREHLILAYRRKEAL